MQNNNEKLKVDRNEANVLLKETIEFANILGASIITLKGKNKL